MSVIMYLARKKTPIVPREAAPLPNFIIHAAFLAAGLLGIAFSSAYAINREFAAYRETILQMLSSQR